MMPGNKLRGQFVLTLGFSAFQELTFPRDKTRQDNGEQMISGGAPKNSRSALQAVRTVATLDHLV